jgi:toxin CcdB
MARNDIYRMRDTGWLVLDVQGLEEAFITSRTVIPLIPVSLVSGPIITRLQPVLELGGERFVMATQAIASVPRKELGCPVGRLDEKWHYVITDAIDVLLGG